MYAAFGDSIDMVKDQQDFQEAFNADQRTFNEYLASLRPQFAVDLAVQQYQREAGAKSIQAAGEGIGKAVTDYYTSDKPTNTTDSGGNVNSPVTPEPGTI